MPYRADHVGWIRYMYGFVAMLPLRGGTGLMALVSSRGFIPYNVKFHKFSLE